MSIPAATATQTTPALPPPAATSAHSAAPPHDTRRLLLDTSALATVCGDDYWIRRFAAGLLPRKPLSTPGCTVAELLLCAAAPPKPKSNPPPPPTIACERQHPMHREAPQAAATANAATPTTSGTNDTRSNQDPMHPEPAGTSPDAATITDPIRVHPRASAAPSFLASNHTSPAPGPNAPSADDARSKDNGPQMHADARGCSAATRSQGQNPVHRETQGEPGSAVAPLPALAWQNPIHRDSGRLRPPADPVSPHDHRLAVGAMRRQGCIETPPRLPDQADSGKNPLHREPPAPAANARPTPAAATRENTPRPGQDPVHLENPAPRTGPLRNGNPRGNPNAAPRCGAKTRSGCPCRAPAVRGKLRCRMHGGASTGPRTEAGLERLRAARTTHGRYTAESRARQRYSLIFLRRSQVKLQALQFDAGLPPAARARLYANPPELGLPRSQPPSCRAQERAIMEREAEALAPWKLAIALARASRHGEAVPPDMVQRLDRVFAALPPLRALRPIAQADRSGRPPGRYLRLPNDASRPAAGERPGHGRRGEAAPLYAIPCLPRMMDRCSASC